MPRPHCPHCLLPVADDVAGPFPPSPMRCPHCRLIIGPHRARADAGDDGDARSRGSAAGVLANAARREHGEPGDRQAVVAAVRDVAARVGCAVERVRMLDYQDAVDGDGDDDLPALATVLATFGTWKRARHAAAHPEVLTADAA